MNIFDDTEYKYDPIGEDSVLIAVLMGDGHGPRTSYEELKEEYGSMYR